MSTAVKLIAAVAFAIVGWLAAQAFIAQLPEDTSTGYFREITAALGFALGWFTLGPKVGRGYYEGVSFRLRTAIFLVFWALLGFSTYFMILRSTKMKYHDVGAAVLDVPMLMLDYGKLLWAMPVLQTLMIGGILAGLVTEFAAKWRR